MIRKKDRLWASLIIFSVTLVAGLINVWAGIGSYFTFALYLCIIFRNVYAGAVVSAILFATLHTITDNFDLVEWFFQYFLICVVCPALLVWVIIEIFNVYKVNEIFHLYDFFKNISINKKVSHEDIKLMQNAKKVFDNEYRNKKQKPSDLTFYRKWLSEHNYSDEVIDRYLKQCHLI